MDQKEWLDGNQRGLARELAEVRSLLEHYAGHPVGSPDENNDPGAARSNDPGAARSNDPGAARSPALDAICSAFGLSGFERSILLLCAGIEMDSRFGPLCAAAHGDPRNDHPTFGLALALFPGAHWSALTPETPLRYWKLVEILDSGTITASPLRIDERALHYLAGINQIDDRLARAIIPLNEGTELLPSHRRLAESLAGFMAGFAGAPRFPLIQLNGDDPESARDIALTACHRAGMNLSYTSSYAVPQASDELELYIRLWQREAILGRSALLIERDDADGDENANAVRRLIERIEGPLFITGRERFRASHRISMALDVKRPGADERLAVWREALGTAAGPVDGRLGDLASRFDFNARAIRGLCDEALASVNGGGEGLENALWRSCRAYSRPRLEMLSRRIEPAASWDDLVLPERQVSTLRELAIHVRRRSRVYDDWGFAAKGPRGLGISALFAGASGTGKTMASEVLANELELDLYRIDLSQVVNKYIGETEKNLRRVFDAAEEGGAILLFDEADALFGKRSEVRDSHDRYANIEVSYLLQRMEAYRGLAILTTNMKSVLDTAFLRRISFIVDFPYPDASQRALIWKRVFPKDVPTEGLDVEKLARLNVVGGSIRNIALNAAFLAADAGEPVRMKHLLHAARGECAKIEKPLTESEIRGWV